MSLGELLRAGVRGLKVRRAERLPGHSRRPGWRVETEAGTFALRLYALEEAEAARGLHDLSAFLRPVGYPVPPAELRSTTIPGELALLQPWLPGEPLLEVLRRSPERSTELGRAFGRLHARLHALPVPDEARARLPVRTLARTRADRTAWLHLDYHPLNILVQGDGPGTLPDFSVLDWENVALGDPRLDVARTLSILSVDPGFWTLAAGERRAALAFRRGYLAGYAATGGNLSGLPPFLAWAGEWMGQDLAHRFTPAQLRHVARWAAYWRGC